LKNALLGLKFSLSYFSLIPIKFSPKDNLNKKEIFGFMLFFFPFVGILISSLIILFSNLGSGWLFFLFLSFFYLFLYGFLHTEALIDVVDALFGLHSQKDPYKIIKEPTVGAMGVLFGVSFLILKLSSLVYLFLEGNQKYLLAIALTSRFGALVSFKSFEFKSSFLEKLKQSFSFELFLKAAILYTLFIFFVFNFNGIFIFGVGITIFLGVVKILQNSLGFVNGDVIGSSIEIVELVLIIGIILFF
jgi:adenosylcobinamide-GDP ribazoletransferase